MSWQLAVAISIIGNVANVLLQRHYAKRSKVSPTLPAAASYLFGVMPIGLLAGLLIFPHAIYWSWWLILLLFIEGVSMAIAVSTGIKASKHLPVVPNMTIGRITIVMVIALGWGILGEGLTMPQFIGASILLIAAVLAIWAPTQHSNPAAKQVHLEGVVLSLVASTTLAISLVTEKAILGHMQIGGVFLVGWGAQTLAMLLLATKDMSRENLRKFRGIELKLSIRMGLASGLTGVFYVFAIYHANNISLVTAIMSITLPLTVLGSYLFLHEREHTKIMWFSVGLSFFGLLVGAL